MSCRFPRRDVLLIRVPCITVASPAPRAPVARNVDFGIHCHLARNNAVSAKSVVLNKAYTTLFIDTHCYM